MHICNPQIPEVGGELVCQLAWSEMTETRDRETETVSVRWRAENWPLTSHTPVQLTMHVHTQSKFSSEKWGVIKGRREKWGKVGWNELLCHLPLKHLLPCPALLEVYGCRYLKPKALLLLSRPLLMRCCSVLSTLCGVKLHVFFLLASTTLFYLDYSYTFFVTYLLWGFSWHSKMD